MSFDEVLFVLWFFLPAGLANATPVFAAKIPLLRKWKTPMDFGKSYRGKRILGDNKTWRGFIFGILVSTVAVYVMHKLVINNFWFFYDLLGDNMLTYLFPNSVVPNVLWLGPLLGAGALLGDAVESFFKRQRGIDSGKSWFPFDQTDYIIGGLLLSLPVVYFRWPFYILTIVVWAGLHLLSVLIGYKLGLRDKPI